jgi:hypothetical protein
MFRWFRDVAYSHIYKKGRTMQKAEKVIFAVFTTLAFLGIVLAIHVHNNPPSCPTGSDPQFSTGYWYCVPKGQLKWGPMRN